MAAMAGVGWGGDNLAMAMAMATGQWRLESGYVKQNEGQGERIKQVT